MDYAKLEETLRAAIIEAKGKGFEIVAGPDGWVEYREGHAPRCCAVGAALVPYLADGYSIADEYDAIRALGLRRLEACAIAEGFDDNEQSTDLQRIGARLRAEFITGAA